MISPIIDSGLFIKNRQRLNKMLRQSSVVILQSNDTMPTNADGSMKFRQNNDLYYLSGINQEQSVLVIFPDAPEPEWQEVLFVRPDDPHTRIWQGASLSHAQASQISGIAHVRPISEFEQFLPQLIYSAEHIYLNTNEHTRADTSVQTRQDRFIIYCKNKFPLHNYQRLAPIMQQLRMIKSEPEIDLLTRACAITAKGFERVAKILKPGLYEYQIEAELAHEFIGAGSDFAGYQPIIASGSNACVLHYIQNNQICKDGDLVLLDFGAGYGGYNADLSRTLPVNGRFSNRQKQVYNAVLSVLRQSVGLLRAGNDWIKYHQQVGKFMQEELLKLGLITQEQISRQAENMPAYKKYFMHGASHHLGLDVHDLGSKYTKFASGMVFTCEPGIYIPEENLGIRLENNILITDNQPIDLTRDIPIEIEEIEYLMDRK